MINETELLHAGYRKYRPSRRYSVKLYQKWIIRDGQRLYALDFDEYPEHPDAGLTIVYSPRARLYTELTSPGGFSVELVERFETVLATEAFFEHVYVSLRCIPDPHN